LLLFTTVLAARVSLTNRLNAGNSNLDLMSSSMTTLIMSAKFSFVAAAFNAAAFMTFRRSFLSLLMFK
jgi:hypothetical protein